MNLLFLMCLAGCATIISGDSHDLSIQSTPVGAVIEIDGIETGKTPHVAKLDTSKDHQINLKLPGYETYYLKLERSTNWWTLGNILIGGVIGIAVDFATGAVYEFDIDTINHTFGKEDQAKLLITLVKNPKNLKKIGQLKKI